MKTLIFDFDGTLADSFDTLLSIFYEVHARPQKLTAAEVADLRGQSIREIIKYLKIPRWRIPSLIRKAKRLLQVRMAGIRIFDGLPEVLAELHRQGHPMFIISTNGRANIREFLERYEIDAYFSAVYGDIGLRGKAPALKKIIRKQKLMRANCVYIGDEVRDIEAARKAGVTSVGVSWGFNNSKAIEKAKPDILVRQPKDLAKYLIS